MKFYQMFTFEYIFFCTFHILSFEHSKWNNIKIPQDHIFIKCNLYWIRIAVTQWRTTFSEQKAKRNTTFQVISRGFLRLYAVWTILLSKRIKWKLYIKWIIAPKNILQSSSNFILHTNVMHLNRLTIQECILHNVDIHIIFYTFVSHSSTKEKRSKNKEEIREKKLKSRKNSRKCSENGN